jgi:hypothetical protein
MAPALTLQAFVGWIAAPAIVFSILYTPILTRLTLGLLSPYGKADVQKRLMAAVLDAFIVASPGFAAIASGRWSYALVGAAYLLLRDGAGGHSAGKLVIGLTVIDVTTGRPAGWMDSVRRNMLLMLPGANLAAIVLETRTMMRDPQGQRLGDRLAQTQVVEGAGVAELVKELEEWLLAFNAGLSRARRRPVRERVHNDRAA